jgi:hypothetical protein
MDRFNRAIGILLDRDRDLMALDANERSITHKLAEYLQAEFEGWNVDCEHNRIGDAAKRIHLPAAEVLADDTDAMTVFPDIIVHRRNMPDNLLVVEVKKTTNPHGEEFDISKLHAFKAELGYRHAAFLHLSTGHGDRFAQMGVGPLCHPSGVCGAPSKFKVTR